MKKSLLFALSLLMIASLVLSGCGAPAETPATEAAVPATEASAPATEVPPLKHRRYRSRYRGPSSHRSAPVHMCIDHAKPIGRSLLH